MYLLEMLLMQNKLNDSTNGLCWVNNITEKGNDINWMRCFRNELVEAIDQSFHWKHWKNIQDVKQYSLIEYIKEKKFSGLHNLKIEITDGWHFIMSEIIMLKKENDFNKDELFDIKFNKKEGKELIEFIEEINFMAFEYEKSKKALNEDKNNLALKNLNDLHFKNLILSYVELTLNVMTLKELYEMYILKNALNFFRQENGYKDGSYIKEWGVNKIEDNVFLDEYFKLEKPINLSDIKDYLTNEYKRLNF